jgi:uncharacterized membrane protein YgcG
LSLAFFKRGVALFRNFVKPLKSSNLRLKFLKAFAMKTQYLLLITALVLVSLVSCSTYKNTTTPDDVYYSPGVPAGQVAITQTNGSDYYSTPNDNYVKMRVQNPDKWSYFDDYNYDYYGSSAYGYGSGFGMSVGFGTPFYGGFGYYSPMSYYNSYYAWNNFYNPYYGTIVVVNGKNTGTPSYTRMSNFNPSAYKGSYYNARPSMTSHFSGTNTGNSQSFYNTHQNNTFNNRPGFSPSPTRSSSFSIGGGGGGSRGGGGFSRPGR